MPRSRHPDHGVRPEYSSSMTYTAHAARAIGEARVRSDAKPGCSTNGLIICNVPVLAVFAEPMLQCPRA